MMELGPITTLKLEDPAFSSLLWKLSPASLAVRLSGGQFKTWPYIQLLSRKLMDVASGKCKRLIVCCPPRHGKPIGKMEPVLMADGSRIPLGEIAVGDYVVTKEGRSRPVLAVFEQGELDCVKITTKTGREVVAALDHPFLSARGWILANEVKLREGLAIRRTLSLDQTVDRLDEEFRLAGYLVGDGCCTTLYFNIYASDDEELADFLHCAETLGLRHSVQGALSKDLREDNICCISSTRGSTARRWMLSSELLFKGAHTKVVPSWVFTSPLDYVAQFIGAYFATDGSISSARVVRKTGVRVGECPGCAIEFGSVSKVLLEGVRHLLSRFGISANLRIKRGMYMGKRHLSWRLIVTERDSVLTFIDNIPVFHAEKRQRMREWKDAYGLKASKFCKLTAEKIEEIRAEPGTFSGLAAKYGIGEKIVWNIKKGILKQFPYSEEYVYDEVVAIEPTKADCRCLQVAEDESFTANDFVVHNSELISKWFIIWFFENYPSKRLILASYEADFASKFGGKARDIIAENQDLLSIRFKAKNPAQHFWETTEGGAMMTAGAGGPITGKGANVFVIDDPIKGSEDANSVTMREKTWDWYTSTARSRLEPGGSMVVVATRWHSDDLIGRILAKEKENIEKIAEGDSKAQIEGWETFVFPAIAEPEVERHYADYKVPVNNLRAGAVSNGVGKEFVRDILLRESDPGWKDFLGRRRGECLCPDRYNETDLARTRSVNLRDWYALFQQRPGDEAEDGNVYHAFNEVVNCKPVARDERMQLFVSVDFNWDPMSLIIGQYDKGSGIRQMERCEILQELVIPNSNTPDAMEKLLQVLKEYQYGYTLELEVYGDAAGTQHTANSRKSNWQLVAEYFALAPFIHYTFRRRKANPTISDRVNAVNTMLKSADGTSRLFINDVKCPELVKDFKKVKYQTDSGGNTTGLLDKSDHHRTHISDALGYAIEYLFSLKVKGGGRKGMLQ